VPQAGCVRAPRQRGDQIWRPGACRPSCTARCGEDGPRSGDARGQAEAGRGFASRLRSTRAFCSAVGWPSSCGPFTTSTNAACEVLARRRLAPREREAALRRLCDHEPRGGGTTKALAGDLSENALIAETRARAQVCRIRRCPCNATIGKLRTVANGRTRWSGGGARRRRSAELAIASEPHTAERLSGRLR